MKHLFAVLLLMVGFVGVSQEVELDPANGPIITFSEKMFQFGEINQGDIVEHIFIFENTGNAPLILSDVKVTCGCTVPSWPKDPIASGESAEMQVRFNSRGKSGAQNKIITIISNAQNSTEKIRIVSQVKLPPPVDPDGN